MAFGITSESQLIDVNTIRRGCEAYIDALDFFIDGGNQIISAGSTCSAKALSVDGSSFQNEIIDLGQQIIALRDEYAACAENVYAQAVQIYNAQVAELNEYNRQLALARQQQAAGR